MAYFLKYRDISSSVWDIFLESLGDIPLIFLHYFQMITNFLFWMRYLSKIFWRYSWDVLTLGPNIFNFLYVCQSVSWLTLLLKLDKYRDTSSSGWYIFLKCFGRYSWVGMLVHLLQMLLNFIYVAFCYLAYFLTEIKLIWGYLQFWMIYLSEMFWRVSWNDCIPDPNSLEFLVCLSVC